MFTGIVTDIGEVLTVTARAEQSEPPRDRLRL